MQALYHRGFVKLAACLVAVGLITACQTDTDTPIKRTEFSDNTRLAADDDISLSVQTLTRVHTGEPFDYRVRVLYRADRVEPDFPALLRNVRFVPFEQVHLSRPVISNSQLTDGTNEYILTYPILGVAVVPHTRYTLDPVRLSWRVIATGEISEALAQPEPVQISGYYPPEIQGQTFQPLRPAINDYFLYKQLGLGLATLLLLVVGGMLVYGAARWRDLAVTVKADRLRQQYESIANESMDERQSLLAYEKLSLTLLSTYRKYTAHRFWTRDSREGVPIWRQSLQNLKQGLRKAYQVDEPHAGSVNSVRETLQQVFTEMEPDIQAERQSQLNEMQGTLAHRIRHHKPAFLGGSFAILSGLFLLVLLSYASLWRDSDTIIYNNWVNSLPQRMFDPTRENELGIIDVQMLVQMSEQYEVLQHLQTDLLKSAYLYNFGTIVARAYVAILAAEDQDEEEIGEAEATNRPSFEFPLQLLANAVRFFPYNENGQRNLELAIMLRELEKKDEESGKVQGEVGPPLPGFSRDMKQLQF